MSQELFAELKELLLYPSSLHWHRLLQALFLCDQDQRELALTYVQAHVDDIWPVVYRRPSMEMWRRQQLGKEDWMWPLVAVPGEPYDELLFVDDCDSLFEGEPSLMVAGGLFVIRRSYLALYQSPIHEPTLFTWQHGSPLELADVDCPDENAVSIPFDSGTLTIEFGARCVRDRFNHHLRAAMLQSFLFDKPEFLASEPKAPDTPQRVDKWTLCFAILVQEPSRSERGYITEYADSACARLGHLRMLCKRSWSSLSSSSQQLLHRLQSPFETQWGCLSDEANEWQAFVSREHLHTALSEALGDIPLGLDDDDNDYYHLRGVFEMLQRHHVSCTLVRVELRWGYG